MDHELRKVGTSGERGFTLIEALVALAIIAAVLTSIGMVIGTTVRGTRAIDQRLARSRPTRPVRSSKTRPQTRSGMQLRFQPERTG